MKSFYLKTFGCQMNVYDGQRIAGMLTGMGCTQTDKVPDADIIILNTCSVREKATNKVFSELGRVRRAKKDGALFGIVGCVAKEVGGAAFTKVNGLNFVLGPQSYHKLPEVISNPDAKLLCVDLSGLEKFDALAEANSPITNHAYIPVQEGCNNFCTYCIVPFTRGREISRPFDDVMRDVKNSGAVEICFLGQNVNGYKGNRNKEQESDLTVPEPDSYSLSDLIRATAMIESVKRIRFTSSYPTKMDDDLIALFGTEPKLLPFLNMPIQSGSESVLKRMNRPYTLDEYITIVDKLRSMRPDIQISSDFIVGFPGETDAEFQATCDIARRVRYINSYSYKYSPRPHTAAATMPDQIGENIKKERLKILDDILTENNRAFNESCVGKVFECLVEGVDKTGNNLICRTPYMQQVIIPRTTNHQSLITIKITDANKSSLRGEVI